MQSNRTTLALASLFVVGLLALWGLDRLRVPTESQRRERSERVLPALIDATPGEIMRVEIVRGEQVLRFDRRGGDAWQMTQPHDVAADASLLETLVRDLKDLRPSPDAGTISGPAESFGLAPPRATVKLWRALSDEAPLTVLEVGKSLRGQTFVRPAGATGIQVADSKPLAAIDLEPSGFRELNLMPIPTFQVTRLEIRRGQAEIKAERSASGQWTLRTPVDVPANGPKIESALAACSAVRVLDAPKGFVADGVTDFSPYGLDRPEATIALTSATRPDAPLVLEVGKRVPGHPDRVYVRRADQDDVVWASDRFLSEIPDRSTAFRSQSVAEITPEAVTAIQIDALGKRFELRRQGDSWQLSAPTPGKADPQAVSSLLTQLDGLQTSEFLEPARVPRPELDPPVMTIQVWQRPDPRRASPATPAGASKAATGDSPLLRLRIGRHDALKKTVYGQLEGDDVILALPDALLEHLPRNAYAYRDRTILGIKPESVRTLTIQHGSVTTVLEPERASATPNQWRMKQPVAAAADIRAVTQVLAMLADLRAEDFVGELQGAESRFGLDVPLLTLSWRLELSGPVPEPGSPDAAQAGSRSSEEPEGWLKVGKPVPGRAGSYYAALHHRPFVFILGSAAVQAMTAEFHDTRVLAFVPREAHRLAFHLDGRTLRFVRRSPSRGDPSDWSPEPGTDPRGIDLSRFNELLTQLSELRATRFLQYGGSIPSWTGLLEPRLLIEVFPVSGTPVQRLRIGSGRGPLVLATTGQGGTGPVFLLHGAAWEALIHSLGGGLVLPENVFAP